MDTKEVEIPKMISNSDSPKIYRPKPKKLCASYIISNQCNNLMKNEKNQKKKYPLTPLNNYNFTFNNQDINNYKKRRPRIDIDEISFEEIEKDFTKLKAKSKINKGEKELLHLLRNSTKDNSRDDEYKETIKIKRPKNPLYKNLKEII